jgi:uncharacterized membrane protein
MPRAVGWSWKVAIVLACVAYQYLVHSSVSSAQFGALHQALMWLPLAALACWVVARSRNKPLWLAVLLAAGASVYLLDHREGLGLAASSGISHAAVYLFLLWYFGSTLAPGREPIIARFARRVHGVLQPAMERFTRELTVVWCAFFAAQLIASALLFAFAPLNAWSLFINLLNLPLLALMFVGQLVYRRFRYPDFPRTSIWQAVEAFTKDASLPKSVEVR